MKRPLLLGHRGARASQHVPENTLASFELCLKHGCDGFEFDVRRAADGQAVICHDPTTRGVEIAKTPSALLGLPTLTQVLTSFSERAFLDIELKVDGLELETVELFRRHPPQKGYVVSSFQPRVLVAVHGIDATIPLGFIFDHPAEMGAWQDLPVDWVMPEVNLTDRKLVGSVHDAGKMIMPWTVNDRRRLRELMTWDVDALISDETQRAAELLGAEQTLPT